MALASSAQACYGPTQFREARPSFHMKTQIPPFCSYGLSGFIRKHMPHTQRLCISNRPCEHDHAVLCNSVSVMKLSIAAARDVSSNPDAYLQRLRLSRFGFYPCVCETCRSDRTTSCAEQFGFVSPNFLIKLVGIFNRFSCVPQGVSLRSPVTL